MTKTSMPLTMSRSALRPPAAERIFIFLTCFFRSDLPDNSRRITCNDNIWRHILSYHRPGADNAVLPDADISEDHGIDTYKYIVLEDHSSAAVVIWVDPP